MSPVKYMYSRRAVLRMLGFFSAVTACPSWAFNRVTDDRGYTLTLTEVPRRIAAISYFGADAAIALGAQVVASTYMVRNRHSSYLFDRLTQAKPLGQRASPNLEWLALARPDLIVAMQRYSEANATRLSRIAPYMALRLETFGDSDRSVRLMGQALGCSALALSLNQKFSHARRRLSQRAQPLKRIHYVFIWGGGSAPWAFYNENMTCTIINALGGINIAGGNPTPDVPENTAFEMSLEALLAADPDVIFVYDYGVSRVFETNPIWPYLTAVRQGRVVYVQDHWIESFGPIARHLVLHEAAHALYPEQFPAVDVSQTVAHYLHSLST